MNFLEAGLTSHQWFNWKQYSCRERYWQQLARNSGNRKFSFRGHSKNWIDLVILRMAQLHSCPVLSRILSVRLRFARAWLPPMPRMKSSATVTLEETLKRKQYIKWNSSKQSLQKKEHKPPIRGFVFFLQYWYLHIPHESPNKAFYCVNYTIPLRHLFFYFDINVFL